MWSNTESTSDRKTFDWRSVCATYMYQNSPMSFDFCWECAQIESEEMPDILEGDPIDWALESMSYWYD